MKPDYTGKQVIVIGAGRTGCSLVRYLLARDAIVTLSDARRLEEISIPGEFAAAGVRLDLGGHTAALFAQADLVAVSPGVPLDLPALHAARLHNVPILGEIEIASRELKQPLAAITGTNGKSTVTTLMGDMFLACGKRTFVGGNLGMPLIEAVGRDWDWLVVELSSFQLETIETFRPEFGVLLNISEDHLDRYPDMASYQAAKARLFENMTEHDWVVLNADDPKVLAAASRVRASRVLFSGQRLLEEGMGMDGRWLVWRWQGEELRFDVGDLMIQGQHNHENVMAAMIPPLLQGCAAEAVWQAATAFKGLPHRMELVGEACGLRWFDDSKGTNIGSVVKSLAGLDPPLTLIAGGKDKQGSLEPLADAIRAKVDHLILIGEAADRMAETFDGLTTIHRAASMQQAVRLAAAVSPPGGIVLLSPGCSSYDMFRSYVERGRVFAEAVAMLDRVA